MWFLILITFLNATLASLSFVAEYRITVAGIPLNVFDGLMLLGLLIAAFTFRQAAEFGSHPLFKVTMVVSVLALAGGATMGLVALSTTDITIRNVITYTRNFATFPIGVLLGYGLLTSFTAARKVPYVMAIAGCITATMILRYFSGRATTFGSTSSIDTLRAVDYMSPYAAVGAVVVIASIVLGARMLPLAAALVMAGYCLLGAFGTLSRSDWIAVVSAMMAIYVCLPREQRVARGLQGLVAMFVLAITLGVGVQLASRATGVDFYAKMATRLRTMLPGEQDGVKHKAWDTRLYGAIRELEEGIKSPLIGRGFGFEETSKMADAAEVGIRHNSWTNTFCEAGLLGVAAMALVMGGSIVVGWRMVKSRTDLTSVLIGALGLATGVEYLVLGVATMSFNTQRGALHLAITFGILLRARTMQSAYLAEYAGYLEGLPHDGGAWNPLVPEHDLAAPADLRY